MWRYKNASCYLIQLNSLRKLRVMNCFPWFILNLNTQYIHIENIIKDRAESLCFLPRLWLFNLLFFLPLLLGGKKKREKNNQSRGKKHQLSARSLTMFSMCMYCVFKFNINHGNQFITRNFLKLSNWSACILIVYICTVKN